MEMRHRKHNAKDQGDHWEEESEQEQRRTGSGDGSEGQSEISSRYSEGSGSSDTTLSSSSVPIWDLVVEYLKQTFTYLFDTLKDNISSMFHGSSKEIDPTMRIRTEEFRGVLCVPYDSNKEDHEALLLLLWSVSRPQSPLDARKSHRWKELGFQGTDPATDFRGGGVFALKNLLYLAHAYPEFYHRVLAGGGGEAEGLPVAITGMNLTMLIVDIIGWGMRASLEKHTPPPSSTRKARERLHDLLFGVSEMEDGRLPDSLAPLVDRPAAYGFHEVYCCVFHILDDEWRRSRATTLDFQPVMLRVRARAEEHIATNFFSLQDVIEYNRAALSKKSIT